VCRHGIKYFSDGGCPLLDCADDPLRDIVGMNVMHHFQPKVGQCKFIAVRDLGENVGVRIRLRVDGHPALANYMTWTEARRRETISARLL
jgi:hypothetical protein